MPSIERLAEQPPSKRREENIGGFVLNGIMFLVDGPRAIINDIMVGEGETVGGAKVAKIKKDKVVLEYKESEVYLDINK
jgi:type II secretory pathway component PulC